MRRFSLLASSILVSLLVSACGSATKKIDPARSIMGFDRTLCIVTNPETPETFLSAFRSALSLRGYTTQILPAHSPVTACPITSTYTASWRWGLVYYMDFSEIYVFQEGKLAGKARYEANFGLRRITQFTSAERTLNEMVNELFPSLEISKTPEAPAHSAPKAGEATTGTPATTPTMSSPANNATGSAGTAPTMGDATTGTPATAPTMSSPVSNGTQTPTNAPATPR